MTKEEQMEMRIRELLQNGAVSKSGVTMPNSLYFDALRLAIALTGYSIIINV